MRFWGNGRIRISIAHVCEVGERPCWVGVLGKRPYLCELLLMLVRWENGRVGVCFGVKRPYPYDDLLLVFVGGETAVLGV